MNKHLILPLSAICALSLHAQPTLQWQRCLGGGDTDEAHCNKQTPDGGFIVAGHTTSASGHVTGNHGAYDAWLVKLDPDGQIQWKRCYGGTGDEWCHSVALTPDGGYVFAGLTYSNNGDVLGNHGDSDAWVVKTDSEGQIQWQRCLGGTKTETARAIQPTPDGGYAVLCRTNSNNGDVSGLKGDYDFWLVKLGPTGQVEWQRCLGGSSEEFPHHLSLCADGGFLAVGETYSSDGDVSAQHKGSGDYWAVKLNAAGEVEWDRSLGGSYSDIGLGGTQTSDGGYAVLGHTSSNNGDVLGHKGGYDIWLVKLSSEGKIMWQKTLGGSGQDRADAVVEGHDGSLYVSGAPESTNGDVSNSHGWSDFWLVKLDQSGGITWERSFGGSLSERPRSLTLCTDGGYLMAGLTFSSDGDVTGKHGSGNADYWVVKLSPESVSTSAPAPALLQISPNPAADGRARVQAGGTPGERLWLTLCDMTGRPLKEQWGTDGGDIDLSGLPPGTYLIRAVAEDGAVRAGRVVKL